MHELTSEVNSRMGCVSKIMAMLGTRTAVADLCMFGLAACDKGGPGFVNVSVRTITNARRVAVRLRSTYRHAQTNENDAIEKGEQTGTWVRQVAGAMEEQLREDQEGLETQHDCRTNARVRIGTPRSTRMTQSRKVSERESGCEQLRNSWERISRS